MHLIPHPQSSAGAVRGIVVEAERRRPGVLSLRYKLKGRLSELCLPETGPSVRTDELWRHTCFEAFVRPAGDKAYYEFNFAPSTAWAAYRFDSYREGMRTADIEPAVRVSSDEGCFVVHALIPIPEESDWRVGLTAVVEDAGGQVSYWSLAHPAGKPDFHHPDCLALELAGSGRP